MTDLANAAETLKRARQQQNELKSKLGAGATVTLKKIEKNDKPPVYELIARSGKSVHMIEDDQRENVEDVIPPDFKD